MNFIICFVAEVALPGHRAPVDVVVCNGVDDVVGRRLVARWRLVADGVFGRGRVYQVDATLLFNRQRLDARVSH